MKLLLGLSFTVFLVFSTLSVRSCTAFYLENDSVRVLAKNLDWPVDNGYVLFNPAGRTKQTFFVEKLGNTSWISKYASITFNQFGIEFPLGGMNSQGLVIEELNSPALPSAMVQASKHHLNEYQFIQYMLDQYASVKEVIYHLEDFQITPIFLYLHYLVADSSGNRVILECAHEGIRYWEPREAYYAVLSNNSYEESLRYLEKFEGFGGDLPVLYRQGSGERFVSAAEKIRTYDNADIQPYAFDILNLVKQKDTQWSIVYNLTSRKIYFRFHNCKNEKLFNVSSLFDNDCDQVLGCDLRSCSCTNVDSFQPYTPEDNTQLLHEVVFRLKNTIGLDGNEEVFEKMTNYAESFLYKSE